MIKDKALKKATFGMVLEVDSKILQKYAVCIHHFMRFCKNQINSARTYIATASCQLHSFIATDNF